MKKLFRGRVILSGDIRGQALVTHSGLNILASFYQCILKDDDAAICSDQDNLELYGQNLTNRIICLPRSIGSTSATAVLDKVSSMGIAPKAFLFSEPIDSLAAAGVVIADVWTGKRIVTLDRLGAEFLDCVKSGQQVEIKNDGNVIITDKEHL